MQPPVLSRIGRTGGKNDGLNALERPVAGQGFDIIGVADFKVWTECANPKTKAATNDSSAIDQKQRYCFGRLPPGIEVFGAKRFSFRW